MKKISILIFVVVGIMSAQVSTIPNELFPQFRTDLNRSLQNAVSITGSYPNPSWITSLGWAKLTGIPAFAPVSFSGAYSDLTGKPSFSNVATSGAYSDLSGKPTFAAVASTGAYSDLTGKPTLQYQTVRVNGSSLTQRTVLNFKDGTNLTWTCVDNVSVTDCTPNATAGAGGYASILSNGGSSLTARSTINFASPFIAVDNSGATRTDIGCQIASSSQAGCLGASDFALFLAKQAALTNPITGTGTIGSLAKFTGTGSIGNAVAGTDFAPATSGSAILKGNGSGGTAAAVAANIISLFSGCSGTMYPGADGVCHADVGGSVFSGSIGATPTPVSSMTISIADISNKSPILTQPTVLVTNVSATFSGVVANAHFYVKWKQAASGGPFTVVYTGLSDTPCAISSSASKWTMHEFFVEPDGTTIDPIGCSTNDTSFGSAAVAFSNLPACSAAYDGFLQGVTDSNTVTWGATITGGSTNHVLAYCDATNWTVAAK